MVHKDREGPGTSFCLTPFSRSMDSMQKPACPISLLSSGDFIAKSWNQCPLWGFHLSLPGALTARGSRNLSSQSADLASPSLLPTTYANRCTFLKQTFHIISVFLSHTCLYLLNPIDPFRDRCEIISI